MRKYLTLFIVIISVIILTGCNILNKEAISVDTFINTVEKKEYQVTDYLNQDFTLGVKNAAEATVDGILVSFFELNDSKTAKNWFDSYKKSFEDNSTGAITTTVNGQNYSSFSITEKKNYVYIVYVDNTFLQVMTTENKKDEVKELLKELGY